MHPVPAQPRRPLLSKLVPTALERVEQIEQQTMIEVAKVASKAVVVRATDAAEAERLYRRLSNLAAVNDAVIDYEGELADQIDHLILRGQTRRALATENRAKEFDRMANQMIRQVYG